MTRFQYLVITNLYYFLMELNKAVSCAGNVFFHYIQLFGFNLNILLRIFKLKPIYLRYPSKLPSFCSQLPITPINKEIPNQVTF